MQAHDVETEPGRRTFAIVFDAGEEVAEGLLAVVTEKAIAGAYFTGIGALSGVTLGYWDWETRDYRRIPVPEQVEVLSLAGNVAIGDDGRPRVHAHIVVGKSDGTAHGGHLLEARVRPTLEVVLIEVPELLRRRHDSRTGLPLLDFNE
ncbi:MAG TPA: PPC domain-containing DNA-binding protein [Gemmatimonadales bacterium]|nr:PPC domain-containing DNA-binding protein [Gemmatimonadales bacterium]